MKRIRLSQHAVLQCLERGANESEVREAIRKGVSESVKKGRTMVRHEIQYMREWQGRFYATKQVAPVIVEEVNEIVVVTVYVFYY